MIQWVSKAILLVCFFVGEGSLQTAGGTAGTGQSSVASSTFQQWAGWLRSRGPLLGQSICAPLGLSASRKLAWDFHMLIDVFSVQPKLSLSAPMLKPYVLMRANQVMQSSSVRGEEIDKRSYTELVPIFAI